MATSSLRGQDGLVAPVLFPPTHRVKSAVWEYFGYLKDAEGMVVCDGFPICKLCYLNVAAKGGNTTNMFKHLKDHHKSIYDEIRVRIPSYPVLKGSFNRLTLINPSLLLPPAPAQCS